MGVTREAIMGIVPEMTSDQLDKMMALYGTEFQAEQKKTEAKAGQVKTLEKQLAELTTAASEAQTEIEKLKKEAADKANQEEDPLKKELRELKEQLAAEKINNYAASNGLSGEHFTKVLLAFNGDVDLAKAAIDGIVTLKNEWEESAKLAREQEIRAASTNPGGSLGNSGNDESFAEQKARSLATKSAIVSADALSQYRR